MVGDMYGIYVWPGRWFVRSLRPMSERSGGHEVGGSKL